MIETVFALFLFSLVAIGLIQGIVCVKKGMASLHQDYQQKINIIETNLEALFLPVEDVQWAISLVLP